MAEANVCGQIVRVVFFILNVLSGIIAAILIAVGGYVIHHRGDFSGSFVTGGGTILIIAGILGVLIVAAGILGAIFLSRFWLAIYIIALGFIVLLEITGCVLGAVFRGKIAAEINRNTLENIGKYRLPSDPEYNRGINDAVDRLQTIYECCGWNSSSNWYPNSSYYMSTGYYPDSCNCTIADGDCVDAAVRTGTQNIWSTPCHDEVIGFFRRNLAIVAGVGGLFAVLEVIPLILGCCLCCLIRKDKDPKHKRLTE